MAIISNLIGYAVFFADKGIFTMTKGSTVQGVGKQRQCVGVTANAILVLVSSLVEVLPISFRQLSEFCTTASSLRRSNSQVTKITRMCKLLVVEKSTHAWILVAVFVTRSPQTTVVACPLLDVESEP